MTYIHLSAAGSTSMAKNMGSWNSLGWKGGIFVPRRRKKLAGKVGGMVGEAGKDGIKESQHPGNLYPSPKGIPAFLGICRETWGRLSSQAVLGHSAEPAVGDRLGLSCYSTNPALDKNKRRSGIWNLEKLPPSSHSSCTFVLTCSNMIY